MIWTYLQPIWHILHRDGWNRTEPCCSEWDSKEEFARHIVEEGYNIEKIMGSLADYFDYERYGRELFMYDYNMGAHSFSALLRKVIA